MSIIKENIESENIQYRIKILHIESLCSLKIFLLEEF